MKQLIARILQWQAVRYLRKYNPKIVAVVGSVGKTSTTQAVASVLSQDFKVRATIKSYNTDLGVPCTIFQKMLPENLMNPFAWVKIILLNERDLRSRSGCDFLALELGTDRPGDLSIFSWLPIDLCVVTAIAEEHMEFFGDLESVAKEELSIAKYCKKLLINKRMVDAKYLSMVSGVETDFYDRSELAQFDIKPTELQVIAEHSLDAVVAAVKVGVNFGMKCEKLKKGAQSIVAQPGRMSKLTGVNDTVLIDDTYNASPKAVTAALDYLYTVSAPQKIVLLGNMNELGTSSAELHNEVGAYCNPMELNLVVTLGPDANKYTAEAARSKGCNVKETATPYKAAEIIRSTLKPGAYVLIKGSQNKVFAEEAVKLLLADSKDVKKLVRQSPFWMVKKRECFGDNSQ